MKQTNLKDKIEGIFFKNMVTVTWDGKTIIDKEPTIKELLALFRRELSKT